MHCCSPFTLTHRHRTHSSQCGLRSYQATHNKVLNANERYETDKIARKQLAVAAIAEKTRQTNEKREKMEREKNAMATVYRLTIDEAETHTHTFCRKSYRQIFHLFLRTLFDGQRILFNFIQHIVHTHTHTRGDIHTLKKSTSTRIRHEKTITININFPLHLLFLRFLFMLVLWLMFVLCGVRAAPFIAEYPSHT